MFNLVAEWVMTHKIITVLLCANSLSFILVRMGWRQYNVWHNAELVRYRPAGNDGKMYYLVAGFGNQPEQSLGFLLNTLNGGITLVKYRLRRGCDMAAIAAQVLEDARAFNFRPCIIGVSVGDYVGRAVESEISYAETIGINPEPEPSVLKKWARIVSVVVGGVGRILTIPLGWLSVLPIYCDCGNWSSFSFLVEQAWQVGTMAAPPRTTTHTLGIICSENDQFLDNEKIKQYFSGVEVYWTEVGHANTVKGGWSYKVAWQQLQADVREQNKRVRTR